MKRHSGKQIVAILRKADVEPGKGLTVPAVCKKIGISEQTYYRWRQKYGGITPAAVQEFKDLQKENSRLKKAVADLTIDKQILSEALAFRGN